MTDYTTSQYIALEMEIKQAVPRINALASPVADSNSFAYNQTPNPDFARTREPYGTTDPNDGYEVKEWIAYTGTLPNGFYYWTTGVDGSNRLVISKSANASPDLTIPIVTGTAMTAKAGERWTATFSAIRTGTFTVSLGAYNGSTYLSDVATVSVSTDGAKTVASTALTPANTTNVRWRIKAAQDSGSLTMYSIVTKREFVTITGWTNSNSKLGIADQTWGIGPTTFKTYEATAAGYHVSNAVPMTAGKWAGAAFDFVGTGTIAKVALEFLNSGGAQVSLVSSATKTGTTSKQRVSLTAQAPANTTQVRMIVYPGSTSVMYWDAAVLAAEAKDQTTAGKTAFLDTAGAGNTNLIINPSGGASSSPDPIGWTEGPGVSVTTNGNNSGLKFNFTPDANVDYRVPNPLYVYSNIMECSPGQWISSKILTNGRGFVRFRYQWLDINDVSLSYSAYSGGTYINSTGFSAIAYGDTMQVPANAYRVRLYVYLERSVNMIDGPFPSTVSPLYGLTFKDATVLTGDTKGAVTGVPNSEVIQWTNLFNQSTSITVDREPMEPGTLTAVVKDATIDPSINAGVRPDTRIRLKVWNGAQWLNLFYGYLEDINVTYPKGSPMITLRALDATKKLFSEKDNYGGVATIEALYYVMEDSDVPHFLDANDSFDGTKRNLLDTSRGQQVILTRDTQKGYAFINKDGTLFVRGRDIVYPAVASQINFSDVVNTSDPNWETYALGARVAYSSKDVINSVTVKQYSISGSNTVETEYGPYVNGDSINEWGLHPVTVTINSGVDPATYANELLALHADPAPQVQELMFPVEDARSFGHARELELCDIVNVEYSPVSLDEQYRVQRLTHRIDPGKWTVSCVFRGKDLTSAK